MKSFHFPLIGLFIGVALVWGLAFTLISRADPAATSVNVIAPSPSGGGGGGIVQQPFVPVVFQFEVVDSTDGSVTIFWRTNGLSQADLVYRLLGSDETVKIEVADTYELEHRYTLGNLESSQRYEMKILAYTPYNHKYESEWIVVSTRVTGITSIPEESTRPTLSLPTPSVELVPDQVLEDNPVPVVNEPALSPDLTPSSLEDSSLGIEVLTAPNHQQGYFQDESEINRAVPIEGASVSKETLKPDKSDGIFVEFQSRLVTIWRNIWTIVFGIF